MSGNAAQRAPTRPIRAIPGDRRSMLARASPRTACIVPDVVGTRADEEVRGEAVLPPLVAGGTAIEPHLPAVAVDRVDVGEQTLETVRPGAVDEPGVVDAALDADDVRTRELAL